MADRIHIFPVMSNGRGFRTTHCTDKTGMCWCKPELRQVCSESDDHGNCETGCWRCGGTGLVAPYDDRMNTLIVHKERQTSDDLNKNTYLCKQCGIAIIDYEREAGALCRSCKKVTRVKF